MNLVPATSVARQSLWNTTPTPNLMVDSQEPWGLHIDPAVSDLREEVERRNARLRAERQRMLDVLREGNYPEYIARRDNIETTMADYEPDVVDNEPDHPW